MDDFRDDFRAPVRICPKCGTAHAPLESEQGGGFEPRLCPSCKEMHPPLTTCANGWAPWTPPPEVALEQVPDILPKVGQGYTLSHEELAEAVEIGTCQHQKSRGKGTRGADTFKGLSSKAIRIKGVKGEIAVAGLMGIPHQARCKDGPDEEPDIVLGELRIEVKTGLALEAMSKLRRHCWYVVVELNESTNTLTVTNVRFGNRIWLDHALPPAHWFPVNRQHTIKMNWRIL